jgi:hypothetical protein
MKNIFFYELRSGAGRQRGEVGAEIPVKEPHHAAVELLRVDLAGLGVPDFGQAPDLLFESDTDRHG